MKLFELQKQVSALVKAGYGNSTVTAASDDEGNSFRDLVYGAQLAYMSDIADVYEGEDAKHDIQVIIIQ